VSSTTTAVTQQPQQTTIPTVLPAVVVDGKFARKVVGMAKAEIMDLVVQNKRRLA
jgi:hypothetical protein